MPPFRRSSEPFSSSSPKLRESHKTYPLSQSKMCPLQLLSANKTYPLGGNKTLPLRTERTIQRIKKKKKHTERIKLSGITPENKSKKTCPRERQQIGWLERRL